MIKFYFLLIGITAALIADERSCEEVFSNVYEKQIWGVAEDGDPSSGWGSYPENASVYINFIQNFLRANSIKKVVDLGCGAWEIMRYVDWTGIDYIGVDVSSKIIALDQKKFGRDHIHFQQADILLDELPDADLLLCKDVLQHLQIKDIKLFLSRINKYKHCLLTNDIVVSKKPDSHFKLNQEIQRGSVARPLDLTLFPFFVKGTKVLTYDLPYDHRKQVLYITN